ncbi:Phage portal protein, SPP1 Gp6-like [Plantibacter flavus]|uniref:SPP1 Gp6-like portal protein n=1 Tax=Plantibacter flavus TaxID=150123 RepID=A0A3N2C0V2_9MICO|nr:phage portal protein [Plantibacter flavus]ROR81121.1 SPP1 Gp6-like portal protein [Plantibacter flavus]SMG08047.1 Phage portal protein, SPP1 Gp6-like [Plantibacter flavus]
MATTPDEWLKRLTLKLDTRQPRIALMRKYSTGDAPMPEMGKNTRASWVAFQKRARTDMGGLLCSSLSGRMVPNGVRVGETANNPAADALRRVWRDNRLPVVFADAIWNALSTSYGYLVTGVRTGDPVITSEQPEQMISAPDPVQPWRAQAALKAWRDDEVGRDYALLWLPGTRQLYTRSSKTSNGSIRESATGSDWEPLGELEEYAGPIPVFELANKNGMSEFEPHIDVIDRINLGKLQRLVVTAMQAYKQRAMKGGLPDKDEEGNDIDWAKLFEPAPGALWDLPEGIDVWESQSTDIRPLLDGEKTDLRDFAAVTQSPIDVFIPDGQNQSATGAANVHKGEIMKAKDRIARMTAPMEGALLSALRILGLDDGSTVQVLWEPPEHVSLSEKSAAAAQAKTAGKSQRWIDQHIWGMSPDEIAEEETARAAEQLSAAVLIGAGSGNA